MLRHAFAFLAAIAITCKADRIIRCDIYFRDPNGHRLELVVNTCTDDEMAELHRVAAPMLKQWSETKKAPQHAAWLHKKEFTGDSV